MHSTNRTFSRSFDGPIGPLWWVAWPDVDAAVVAELLDQTDQPVRTALELGSDGGNNAWYLEALFDLTLSDVSADM